MKICISINGVDGSGKTTQLEMLQKRNPDIIESFGGLEQYSPYKECSGNNSFEWWFYKSTPDEFCYIMYSSIAQRNREIKRSKKPIILIDKGINNFDARIIATLQFKGLSMEQAKRLVREYKEKCNVLDIEDLKLFFSTAKTTKERMQITKDRVMGNMDSNKFETYRQYQFLQNNIIEEQIASEIYTVFDAKGTISEVNQRLTKKISEIIERRLRTPENKTVFALGGMSECGKSGAGDYLSRKHNIWNMKLKYLNRNICQRYDIEDLFRNDPEFTSLLLSEEINDLLNIHYYKAKVSFESLHDFQITQRLKEIYGESLKVIFIDTNYKNRVIRTALGEHISIEEAKKVIDIKDNQKSAVGADKIKEISDHIIDNNGTQMQFREQLDDIVIDKQIYNGELRKIESFKIPEDYRSTLEKFYKDTESELQSNIKMFLVTGSCARGCVEPGWSDIDVILVVDKNNEQIRSKLAKSTSSSKIKIGTTVYSEEELKKKRIDLKTAYALYEMQRGTLKPSIYSSTLELPVITNNELKEMCSNIIPSSLHTLRRLLYVNGDKEKDIIFKELSHLMRDYLLQENINANDYQDVFDKFANTFGFETFDTQKFISREQDQNIIKFCNNVIDNLTSERQQEITEVKKGEGIEI